MISHYCRETSVVVGQPQDVCIYFYCRHLLFINLELDNPLPNLMVRGTLTIDSV